MITSSFSKDAQLRKSEIAANLSPQDAAAQGTYARYLNSFKMHEEVSGCGDCVCGVCLVTVCSSGHRGGEGGGCSGACGHAVMWRGRCAV
jgi:hypothetical protein